MPGDGTPLPEKPSRGANPWKGTVRAGFTEEFTVGGSPLLDKLSEGGNPRKGAGGAVFAAAFPPRRVLALSLDAISERASLAAL